MSYAINYKIRICGNSRSYIKFVCDAVYYVGSGDVWTLVSPEFFVKKEQC